MRSLIGSLPTSSRLKLRWGMEQGFLYNDDRSFLGIATALHVVNYASDWQQPIRFWHLPTTTTMFVKVGERIIFTDPDTDSAIVLVHPGELKLPDDALALLPPELY